MMIQPLLRRVCYSQLKKQASLNVTIRVQSIISFFFSYCALSDIRIENRDMKEQDEYNSKCIK